MNTRRVLASLLVVAGGLLAPCAATVGAQQFSLTLTEATAWVPADGVFRAVFAVTTPLPDGSTVTTTVHRRIRGSVAEQRQGVLRIAGGGSPGAGLQNPVVTPAAQLIAGEQLRYELPIRARSGSSERTLIPDAGVYPISVRVADPAGAQLGETVVFLNRRPAIGTREPFDLVMALASRGPAPFDENGAPATTDEVLRDTRADADVLESGIAPVAVSIDPTLLSELTAGPEGLPLLSRLSTAVGGRPVLRTPWVALDLNLWRGALAVPELQRHLVASDDTTAVLETARRDQRTWTPDETLNPGAVSTLNQLGIDRFLLDNDQLIDPDPRAWTSLRPVAVNGSADSSALALVTDPIIQDELEGDADRQPASRANVVAALLNQGWLAADPDQRSAAYVDLSPAVPAVAAALVAAASESDDPTGIDLVAPADAFDKVAPARVRAGRTDVDLSVELRSGDAEPVGPARVRDLNLLRTRLAAWKSSQPGDPGDPDLDLMLLRASDRRVPEAAFNIPANVNSTVNAGLASVVAPPERSITLTARNATIPLRVENTSNRPMTVAIEIDSSRIEVNGGQLDQVVLAPGTTRVDVAVSVLTSGQFDAGVTIRTADRQIVLGRTVVRVRSQVFSGVGVVLSAGALVFLLIWWSLTLRRRRKARSISRHPTRPGPPDPGQADPGQPDPERAVGTETSSGSEPGPAS